MSPADESQSPIWLESEIAYAIHRFTLDWLDAHDSPDASAAALPAPELLFGGEPG